MSIIVQGIPSMHGGVSQQSAVNRAPNQCEEAINTSFSVANGASKRPPMETIMELVTGENPDAFIEWTHASDGTWFVIVIPGDGTFRVHKVDDGTILTDETSDTDALDYLICEGPAWKAFRATATEGGLYIVNREVQVQLADAVTDGTITGTVQTLQDDELDNANYGEIWRITGSELGQVNTHYAKHTTDGWVEWVQPGIPYRFDTRFMPHFLEVISDEVDPNDFVVKLSSIEWEDRRVGDVESNKAPSFVGRKINGITFEGDRLILLSGRGFSASRTGRHHDFWRSTVTQVPDDDRIDAEVDEDQITGLTWMANVSGFSTLFARDRQFTLDAEPALTPSTAVVRPVTRYPASPDVPPLVSGPNVFFASNAGDHTHLRELFLQEDSVTLDAANASAHSFAYVPADIRTMEVHSHYDHVLMVSEREPDTIYSYQYLWSGDEKVLSAWAKWQLAGDVKILSVKQVEQWVYVVYQSTGTYDGLFLGRIDLKQGSSDAGFPHKVHLDHRVQLTGQYNSTDDRTYFTSPFPMMEEGHIEDDYVRVAIVLGDGFENKGRMSFVRDMNGYLLHSGFQFSLLGDWSQGEVYIGLTYPKIYRFSEQFFNDGNGRSLNVRLQLRNMQVHFTDTAFFRAHIKSRGREPQSMDIFPFYKHTYTSRTLNDEWFSLNRPEQTTGVYNFPVMGKASDTTIELINDSYMPSHFQAAEWRALISRRMPR